MPQRRHKFRPSRLKLPWIKAQQEHKVILDFRQQLAQQKLCAVFQQISPASNSHTTPTKDLLFQANFRCYIYFKFFKFLAQSKNLQPGSTLETRDSQLKSAAEIYLLERQRAIYEKSQADKHTLPPPLTRYQILKMINFRSIVKTHFNIQNF